MCQKTKACKICGNTKPVDEENFKRNYGDNFGNECNVCRDVALKKKLAESNGLTVEEFDKLLPEVGFQTCSACGVEKPLNGLYFHRRKVFTQIAGIKSFKGFKFFTTCKTCDTEKQRKKFRENKAKEIGMSPEEYKKLLDSNEMTLINQKRKTPKEKTCSVCKENFPATTDHFHNTISKWVLDDGTVKTKKTLSCMCKKCDYNDSRKHIIQKRLEEHGWTREEYDVKWAEHKKKVKAELGELLRQKIGMKHGLSHLQDELRKLPEGTRGYLYKKIVEEGYIFTSAEQYRKDRDEEGKASARKTFRKYEYPKEYDNKSIGRDYCKNNLTDSYVADLLGGKPEDFPQEVLETKRLTVSIKREIKQLS